MADEQHRWLDRGTAERLLSGEPPEIADPVACDQARQLAGTLHALSAPPPPDSEELPGEAAALAAFRKVREEREGQAEAAHGAGRPAGTRPSDIGPIHIGPPHGDRSGTADGPRRGRSLHLGLAAALVAGMAGGAAVLAGTGVLSPPDGSRSDPAASVTATGTHPERPLASPPPKDAAPGGVTPEDRHSESAAGTAEDGAGADGSRAPGKPDADTGDGAARSGRGGKQISAACRAWRDGEALNGEREHLLEDAAGGPSRVGPYCEGVLSTSEASGASGTTDTDEGARKDNGKANSQSQNQGQSQSQSQSQDQGQGQSQSSGADKGNSGNGGNGGNGGNSGNGGKGGKENP